MKTFQEFLEETSSYRKHPHFSSKEELEKHYGGIPSWALPKNRGSKENPQWGLSSKKSQLETDKRREENTEIATGQLTPREKRKVESKRAKARREKKDVHHGTELETSAKEMRVMSPGQRIRYKTSQAKERKYHGDDPKNLVLATRGSVDTFRPEQPGFHHGKYHAFERSNREKLKDLEGVISSQRAFTTLVNQARRRSRRRPELVGRMAATAKAHGITND
jgi:hypothetical protein